MAGRREKGSRVSKRPRARPSRAAKARAAKARSADGDEVTRLEGELRLAEAKFAGIVGISADAILVTDETQRILMFNQGAEAIFGYRADEVIGQPLLLLLPESDRGAHPAHLRVFATSGVNARLMGARRAIRGRRKSGELFPAEASISQVQLATGKLFAAVLRDVTERAQLLDAERTAREAAQAEERRSSFLAEASALLDRSLDYETTLGTLASLVVPVLADFSVIDVAEPDGEVRRVGAAHADPACARLMEAMRGIRLDRSRPFIGRHTLLTGQIERVPLVDAAWIQAHTQDDAHRDLVDALAPASYVVLPLRVRDQVVGAMSFVRCDRPRPYSDAEVALAGELARRAGQAVENARLYGVATRAIQARDDVLAIVSHDLRNPLSAIAMYASTLQEQPALDQALRTEMLGMMRQSVDWMNRIIQDLLDITSIEAGKLSVYRERKTVRELLTEARASLDPLAKGHAFSVIEEPGLPAVSVDVDRMVQALANLVGNAAKFTPSSGAIEVRAERDGRAVRFSVRDRGSGIPADELPHIFDRFWHARRDSPVRGTGLGLAIAKGIVEAHGGELEAESVVGRGSVFRFSVMGEG